MARSIMIEQGNRTDQLSLGQAATIDQIVPMDEAIWLDGQLSWLDDDGNRCCVWEEDVEAY